MWDIRLYDSGSVRDRADVVIRPFLTTGLPSSEGIRAKGHGLDGGRPR